MQLVLAIAQTGTELRELRLRLAPPRPMRLVRRIQARDLRLEGLRARLQVPRAAVKLRGPFLRRLGLLLQPRRALLLPLEPRHQIIARRRRLLQLSSRLGEALPRAA